MFNQRSSWLRWVLGVTILVSIVGCDQATKELATKSLQDQVPHTYLSNTVRLEYALNPGGFLSVGASLPSAFRKWVFVGINSILLTAVAVFLVIKRRMHLMMFVSFTSILAGGIGNLIDRVNNAGQVIDFINVGVGPLRTGVFNVADVGVTGGVVALFIMNLTAAFSGREGPESGTPVT